MGPGVKQMSLAKPEEGLDPLSTAIGKKTRGNAFF
jgi:hypothetical protein